MREHGRDATAAYSGHGLSNRAGSEKHSTGSVLYGRRMKTMTCKQLGGPCDFPLPGSTADEVIKLQDAHLKEMVAGGDETHRNAADHMKGRWKHPVSGMKWYRATKRDFAALAED